MLKGAGFAARGQNIFLEHSLQSAAMVAGHNTAGILGISERPEGSLAEQLLHAEATNLQMGAGMGLAYHLMPGVHALERGLDLSLSSRSAEATTSLITTFSPELAVAVGGERNPDLSFRDPLLSIHTVQMSQEGSDRKGEMVTGVLSSAVPGRLLPPPVSDSK